VDPVRAARAVREYLLALGLRPDDDVDLAGTVDRVVATGLELFAGVGQDAVAALTRGSMVHQASDQLIALADIPFRSTCQHHLLPFEGTASVVYQPGGRIAGLGAVVAALDVVSSRPQLQERLTEEVADSVAEGLQARGVLVVTRARHGCVWARSARLHAPELRVVTHRGVLSTGELHGEALALAGVSRA
jgi:GTP cyclohydrolase I